MLFDRLNQRFADWMLQRTMDALERLAALREDNQGQDLMEYAIIGGVIVTLVLAVVWRFGARLAQLWNRMTNGLR